MKKLLAMLMAAAGLLAVSGGVASAEPGGGQGNSDHGLCTAYFNGQKVGHDGGEGESGDYPKPFEGLESRAEYYTDQDGQNNDPEKDTETDEGDDLPGTAPGDEHTSLTDAENIFNFCDDAGLIGGNPDHGRFACVNQDPATDGDSDGNLDEPDDAPPYPNDPLDPTQYSDPECRRQPKPGNGDPQAGKSKA